MSAKLMKCVKDVKEASANRKKKVNPWSVCVASTGQKPEHKKKRS